MIRNPMRIGVEYYEAAFSLYPSTFYENVINSLGLFYSQRKWVECIRIARNCKSTTIVSSILRTTAIAFISCCIGIDKSFVSYQIIYEYVFRIIEIGIEISTVNNGTFVPQIKPPTSFMKFISTPACIRRSSIGSQKAHRWVL